MLTLLDRVHLSIPPNHCISLTLTLLDCVHLSVPPNYCISWMLTLLDHVCLSIPLIVDPYLLLTVSICPSHPTIASPGC